MLQMEYLIANYLSGLKYPFSVVGPWAIVLHFFSKSAIFFTLSFYNANS